MKNKPNQLLHMMNWGFVSGIILSLMYMVIMLGFQNKLDGIISSFIAFPFLPATTAFLGAISGLVFGFIDGLILWHITKAIKLPFTVERMRETKGSIYLWMFGATGILGGTFVTFLFALSGYGNLIGYLFFLLPALIAAIAAAYAGHRYLFRLRLWSDREFGARKQKSKHDFAHLEENSSDTEVLDEALVDSQNETLNP